MAEETTHAPGHLPVPKTPPPSGSNNSVDWLLYSCVNGSGQPTLPGSRENAGRPVAFPAGQTSPPRVAGYVIEAELGRGGMGVVYKARHLGLDRTVALKMILAGAFTDDENRARFLTEARAVARLSHPNIVQVFDSGEHEGLPFYALEFVDGPSLDQQIQGQPQPPDLAARCIIALARGIHAAHQAGVIHRDLKPANVLLRDEGRGTRSEQHKTAAPDTTLHAPLSTPLITDFGLAHCVEGGSGQTRTGDIMGTPQYMAPEQAAGKSKTVTPAADIYALGVILYECLTGRPPFVGIAPMDTLLQVLYSEPVPPTRLQPKIPRDLETICLKCLQKEPHRRYLSALALAEDLERYVDGRPILARPVGPIKRAWKWGRRRPAIAGLLAGIVFVTMLGFAGITWQWRIADSERAKKVQEALAAQVAKDEAETHLTYSQVVQAALTWERHDVGKARELLDSVPEHRRGWEWHYLRRLCHGHMAERLLPHWVHSIAVSPDGKWTAVAYGSPYDNSGKTPFGIRRFRMPEVIAHGEDITVFNGAMRHLAIDSNGQLLTVDGQNIVRRFDVASGEPLPADPRPIPDERNWLSPNGRWRISWMPEKIRLWDLEANRALHELPGFRRPVRHVTFDACGSLMATVDDDDAIRVFELPGMTERFRLPPGSASWASLSADGKYLALNCRNRILELINATNAKELWKSRDSKDRLRDLHHTPVFSPDGNWVAVQSVDDNPRVWSVANGGEGTRLVGHKGRMQPVRAVTFTPDSRWVVSTGTDGTVRLWDPETGQGSRIYRGHRGGVFAAACSPDGRQLVTGGGGAHIAHFQLMVWDLTRDQDRLQPSLHRGRHENTFAVFNNSLQFTTDNRLLFARAPCGVAAWDAVGNWLGEYLGGWDQVEWPAWHGMMASADGRLVARRRRADLLEVFDLPAHRSVQQWKLPLSIRTVAISPDGKLAAAATFAQQVGDTLFARIKVFDIQSGSVVWEIEKTERTSRLAFSPDGKLIALGMVNGVVLVELTTGTLRRLSNEKITLGLAFQLNGPLLAVTSGIPSKVQLFDINTNNLVREWGDLRLVGDVAFHPDGNRLAVHSREGIVTIHDTASGQNLLTLEALTGRDRDLAYPPRLAFSPDGRRLAANDFLNGLHVWEADDPGLATEDLEKQRRQAAAATAYEFHLRCADAARLSPTSAPFQFHLRQLKTMTPPTPMAFWNYLDLLGYAGEWHQVAGLYRKWRTTEPAATLDVAPETHWDELAMCLLMSGDIENYRHLCSLIHARWGGPTETTVTHSMAFICGYGPQALADPKSLVAYGQQLTNEWRDSARAHLALGLSQFRVGAVDDAQKTLSKGTQLSAAETWVAPHLAGALALVLQRQGHHAEARRQIQILKTWLATLSPTDAYSPERLGGLVLEREFEKASRSNDKKQK